MQDIARHRLLIVHPNGMGELVADLCSEPNVRKIAIRNVKAMTVMVAGAISTLVDVSGSDVNTNQNMRMPGNSVSRPIVSPMKA
jgi:hypothetical protein